MLKCSVKPFGLLLLVGLLICLNACTRVGPDFAKPTADVAPEWSEIGNGRVQTTLPQYKDWWRLFDDPILENLVETAYEQNLPLRIAGVRVLEARALLGVVAGQFYPQSQAVSGGLEYNRLSGSSIELWPGSG